MRPQEIARYIDHTLLKADATPADVKKLCAEARAESFYAVCVNSVFVPLCVVELQGSNVKVAAVVGFPLGAMDREAKAFETKTAVTKGASEIDTVVPVGLLKAGLDEEVLADLRAVVNAAGKAPVKVILETSLLNHDEKVRACLLSEKAGAAFVKTSTGFGGGGASVEDVKLMKASVSEHIQVKASGGVRSLEQALAMIEAGATRLGTSSGVAIVRGTAAGAGY